MFVEYCVQLQVRFPYQISTDNDFRPLSDKIDQQCFCLSESVILIIAMQAHKLARNTLSSWVIIRFYIDV